MFVGEAPFQSASVPASTRLLHALAIFAVLAVALAFRLPRLDERPMHGDEANQAVKAGTLFDKGVYRYDPHEHHGPTLYYFTLPSMWLSGAKRFAETSEFTYRIVPALFGVGVVLLAGAFARGIGRGAAFWAALLTAVSHGMTYFSRYYIQEMLLVFFTAGLILSGWKYARTKSLRWAVLAGLCLGLMHATKETTLVLVVALAAALVLTRVLGRLREGTPLLPSDGIRPVHIAVAGISAAAISVIFFSSFFTYSRGPLDSILAYATYFHRAEGQGSAGIHDKPWFYYLELLCYVYRSAGPRWSEGLILALGAFGIGVALGTRMPGRVDCGANAASGAASCGPLLRFLAFYTILVTAAYSMIPYKTPWNAIVFLQPLILMAGVGAVAMFRLARWRPIKGLVALLLLAGMAQLAHQSWLGNFRYPADPRNPYVYAHTSTALMRLVQRFDQIAAANPDGRHMQINIFCPNGDYWPLPWYLRAYDRVGYWRQFPEVSDAPMIIADPRLRDELDQRLKDRYQVEFHALRPGVLLLAYIRQDLWDAFMRTRS